MDRWRHIEEEVALLGMLLIIPVVQNLADSQFSHRSVGVIFQGRMCPLDERPNLRSYFCKQRQLSNVVGSLLKTGTAVWHMVSQETGRSP
jgi:hypothetical protein